MHYASFPRQYLRSGSCFIHSGSSTVSALRNIWIYCSYFISNAHIKMFATFTSNGPSSFSSLFECTFFPQDGTLKIPSLHHAPSLQMLYMLHALSFEYKIILNSRQFHHLWLAAIVFKFHLLYIRFPILIPSHKNYFPQPNDGYGCGTCSSWHPGCQKWSNSFLWSIVLCSDGCSLFWSLLITLHKSLESTQVCFPRMECIFLYRPEQEFRQKDRSSLSPLQKGALSNPTICSNYPFFASSATECTSDAVHHTLPHSVHCN